MSNWGNQDVDLTSYVECSSIQFDSQAWPAIPVDWAKPHVSSDDLFVQLLFVYTPVIGVSFDGL